MTVNAKDNPNDLVNSEPTVQAEFGGRIDTGDQQLSYGKC